MITSIQQVGHVIGHDIMLMKLCTLGENDHLWDGSTPTTTLINNNSAPLYIPLYIHVGKRPNEANPRDARLLLVCTAPLALYRDLLRVVFRFRLLAN